LHLLIGAAREENLRSLALGSDLILNLIVVACFVLLKVVKLAEGCVVASGRSGLWLGRLDGGAHDDARRFDFAFFPENVSVVESLQHRHDDYFVPCDDLLNSFGVESPRGAALDCVEVPNSKVVHNL
jgi:hypothetical protein